MGARERTALFNALMARKNLRGAKVLDAYAGTGALGIEALSRGAREVTFIEKSRSALTALAENIEAFGIAEMVGIVAGAVEDFRTTEKYDLILVDPPYDRFQTTEFRGLVKYLADGGLMAVSHPWGTEVELEGVRLVMDRKYARAGIAIFEI